MVMEVTSGATNMAKLLADMRQMREKAIQDNAIPTHAPFNEGMARPGVESQAGVPDFSSLLKNAIEKVNDVQLESGALKKSYEVGDPRVDITQVMVASQKANVAFEAMKQVRNKLVDAYRDVMNMPI